VIPLVDELEAVVTAAVAADEKSGDDTVVLDVGAVLGITGHFVITSGGNNRMVRTLAEEIERAVAVQCDIKPLRVEGLDGLRWVLLDYGDFVAHVFHSEDRAYYDLERLWSDVDRVDWRSKGAASS
jgi:ribosome-associated protein